MKPHLLLRTLSWLTPILLILLLVIHRLPTHWVAWHGTADYPDAESAYRHFEKMNSIVDMFWYFSMMGLCIAWAYLARIHLPYRSFISSDTHLTWSNPKDSQTVSLSSRQVRVYRLVWDVLCAGLWWVALVLISDTLWRYTLIHIGIALIVFVLLWRSMYRRRATMVLGLFIAFFGVLMIGNAEFLPRIVHFWIEQVQTFPFGN